ncbi:hypothetical protein XH93_07490 [Bradyrhizobium sp. CCBAU 51753]|nr:hypothetical protein XH93_07490 [Bradyrhizobium sp. CCBAU 51753]
MRPRLSTSDDTVFIRRLAPLLLGFGVFGLLVGLAFGGWLYGAIFGFFAIAEVLINHLSARIYQRRQANK